MIINLIGTLASIVSVFCLLILLFKMKSREYLSWMIKEGRVCKICKEDNELYQPLRHLPPFKNEVVCAACKRDQSISEVLGKTSLNPLSFLTSSNWSSIYLILIILSVFIQFINLIFHKSGYFGLFGGLLLLLFAQIGNYYNFMKMSRPKNPKY
jgi:hypothetical protein